MTREELTKQAEIKFQKKVPMPCYVVGAQWAYDTLSKQHEEEVRELVEALEKIDDDWFQPGPESGVCGPCDGGQDPSFMNDHEPHCPYEIAHKALSAHRARQQAWERV